MEFIANKDDINTHFKHNISQKDICLVWNAKIIGVRTLGELTSYIH